MTDPSRFRSAAERVCRLIDNIQDMAASDLADDCMRFLIMEESPDARRFYNADKLEYYLGNKELLVAEVTRILTEELGEG